MRSKVNILAMMAAACFCAFTPAIADDDDAQNAAREDKVKVAFLYNFVKFVEWPGSQSLSRTHAVNVCITGKNPFGDALAILQKASTPQLAFNVKTEVKNADIPACHILFIMPSRGDDLSSLLASARAYPVLTVSEMKGFADNGGIIEMAKTEKDIGLFSKNKIQLRVNVKVAEQSGLHLDAQLLEIATEVIK